MVTAVDLQPESTREGKKNSAPAVDGLRSTKSNFSYLGTIQDQVQSESGQYQEINKAAPEQEVYEAKERAEISQRLEVAGSGSTKDPELDKLVDVSQEVQVISQATKAPGRLQRLVGRSEIPETPPVCLNNSPLVLSETRLEGRSDGYMIETCDINGGNSAGKICSVCKKQRVLAKGAVCNACKTKGQSLDADPSTCIPETPQSPLTTKASHTDRLITSAYGTPTSTSSESQKPGSWSQWGIKLVKPKIVTKVVKRPVEVPEERIRTDADRLTDSPTPSQTSTTQRAEDSNAVSSERVDSATSILSPNQDHSADYSAEEGTESASIDDLFEDYHSETLPVSVLSEPVRLVRPVDRLALDKKPPDDSEQLEAEVEVMENGRKEDTMELDALPLGSPETAGSEAEAGLHHPVAGQRANVSIRTSARRTASIAGNSNAKRGQFTFRQLIGQALLASDGAPLTTAEVQNWIAKTFPQTYRKGASWEKNISPILSQTHDFLKIESTDSKQKGSRWSFANAKARDKYERLASEPRIPAPTSHNDVTTTIRGATRKPSRLNMVENMEIDEQQIVSNSAPAEPTTLPETVAIFRALLLEVGDEQRARIQSGINYLEQHERDKVLGAHESEHPHASASTPIRADSSSFTILTEQPQRRGEDLLFNPFEAETCTNPASYSPSEIRVETDFYKAFPEHTQSIYGMTEEEREKKIAAIRARPSRKATFGKLLATARYHRKDVHNELESDKPRPSTATPKITVVQIAEEPFWDTSTISQADEEVAREANSLKEAFDMPQNLIPKTYSGKLAFRDGTLVNGRLPRAAAQSWYIPGKK
ncbi:hypothetical protein K491DRAFT_710231 [Lophiostoma macrostomum CBS 122681]|uniref:Fork-head domain-containing protein n=1 Tax=Lophiostoma macrostomum CBS 122681 TaxID=1314788 RepID=A0A6A6TQE7_9PLEO|nr:hypothetical protein K491DRAFT_710231 [Lophiostoma macrostomum CBS 122681]